MDVVIFAVEERRHALKVQQVERVVAAVAVDPLPGAPAPVAGAIDVAGELVPAYCLRRRLALPARVIRVTDRLVLARTARRRVALLVDEVGGVHACEAPMPVDADPLIDGVVRLPDGLLLIHDLDRFLTPAQEEQLDAALGSSA